MILISINLYFLVCSKFYFCLSYPICYSEVQILRQSFFLIPVQMKTWLSKLLMTWPTLHTSVTLEGASHKLLIKSISISIIMLILFKFFVVYRSRRWPLTPSIKCRGFKSFGSVRLVLNRGKAGQVREVNIFKSSKNCWTW